MTDYFSATPRSLFILQILSAIIIFFGLFFLDFTWSYFVLSIVFFYLYSIVGISMMLHRYYTHKSFKLNSTVQWILTIFSVLAGRGSPLGWVYIHRIHHATSDTEKDPHSPHYNTFKFIGFRPNYDSNKKINYFIIKELLTPAHIKIDKYYMLLVMSFIFILSVISFDLVLYVWAIPVFATSISQTAFNYFCHITGYRNFNTSDQSTNNIYMWPFILGDAWHNNHHGDSMNFNTKVKWWEFDPVASIIKLVSTKNV